MSKGKSAEQTNRKRAALTPKGYEKTMSFMPPMAVRALEAYGKSRGGMPTSIVIRNIITSFIENDPQMKVLPEAKEYIESLLTKTK